MSCKEKVDQKVIPEESNQVNEGLQDSDLDNVAGGAYPTAVNDQITDAVT